MVFELRPKYGALKRRTRQPFTGGEAGRPSRTGDNELAATQCTGWTPEVLPTFRRRALQC